jgi:hypothetical protein
MTNFGMLTGMLAVALIIPEFEVPSVSFRVSWGVGYAIVLALLITSWIRRLRHPQRLEITGESVRYLRGKGRQKAMLSRQHGDELRILEKRIRRGGRLLWLVQLSSITDRSIPLDLFPVEEVRQACLACQWRFDAIRLDLNVVRRYLKRDTAP